MNDRSKRLLAVGAFVIVALIFGAMLWFFFFKPVLTPINQVPSTTSTLGGLLPTPGTGAPTAVSGTVPGAGGLPVTPFVPQLPASQLVASADRTQILSNNITLFPSLSPTGNAVRSYNPTDGKFYRIDDKGNLVAMSDQAFYNVQKVTWASHSNKSILEFPDGSKVLYDFDQSQQATLPNYWEDFSFNPQDSQIAAKAVGNNPDNRFLVTSNPDGTQAKAVEELGNNQDKVDVSWSPNNQVIAFGHTADPIGFDREQIILVGQNHENFKNLVVEGRGFVPNWSPDGQQLLYSVYNTASNYRPTLWISGAQGNDVNANRRDLKIQTWADKCTWRSATNILCAVPIALDDGAGLQPSLYRTVPDTLVSINLTDGTVTNLGEPTASAVINNMVVGGDGSYIMYTDGLTGQLVRYRLGV